MGQGLRECLCGHVPALHTPGTTCAGKGHLLKHFADGQATVLGDGEESAILSKTCGLFESEMDTYRIMVLAVTLKPVRIHSFTFWRRKLRSREGE